MSLEEVRDWRFGGGKAARRRGVSIIEPMVIDMNEALVRSLEQVRQVLEGTQSLEFRRAEDDEGRYAWIELVLLRLSYRQLGRADRGSVLAYVHMWTMRWRAPARSVDNASTRCPPPGPSPTCPQPSTTTIDEAQNQNQGIHTLPSSTTDRLASRRRSQTAPGSYLNRKRLVVDRRACSSARPRCVPRRPGARGRLCRLCGSSCSPMTVLLAADSAARLL